MGKILVYDPVLKRPKNVWVNEDTLKLIEQMRAERGLPPLIRVEAKDAK